jgi:Lamin Tail Domain
VPQRPRSPSPLDRTGQAALLLAALTLSACGLGGPRVVISEFLAANGNGLTDQDQDTSDWIELFNPEQAPASLAGWCLTDNPRQRSRWCFADVSIPAQGYLVVFASGKRPPANSREQHASFKLRSSPDFLGLSTVRGNVASEFSYPEQRQDISFGLTRSGVPSFLARPTPGAPNSEALGSER